MAQSYTRQSSFSDGDTITAALFNNEYDQLVNAFAYSSSSASSTGHRHDGTAAHGGNIHTIGDLDFLNKIVADSTNNRWGVFVEVSSAAVEQIRIQDGAIVPVTDNDIDLGTSSLEFKDLFIDGTAHVDTLDVDVNGTVAGTFGVTGATTLSSTLAVTGAVTGSSTIQGTTITATTAFVPDASDGAALGTSALEFSDLFLADGAVINFGDDQDVSLTHVADTGILLSSTDQLQFGDSGTYIYQSADGVLDLVSDTEIEINATTIDINGAADVSGNLAVGGNLTVTGNATIAGNLTFGDAASDTVAFSADVASNLLPSADNTYDLGASGSEWKDLYLDGTANIDSLVADTADINGGTVDGAIIGGASAAAITGTAITGTSFVIGSADISEAELETIDGVTAGTVAASKAVVVDSNKDIGTFRNVTIDGTFSDGNYTFDTSGNVSGLGTIGSGAITSSGTVQGTTITATTAFVPDASDGAALGTSALEFSDLFLADGAVINFGDDQDVSLTHVADTGLLISSTDQLQFGDSGTYIYQSADGVLDLVSDTEIELTATTIDINGAVAMDGAITGGTNITISGELDAATLDISGNADIDGTLEADAYTVDGTALNEYIADTVGAMVSSNTETDITVTYDDGDNTLDFVVGNITGTAALATSVTASANNSTDETVYPTFVDGATGTQGIETDTGLTYNPSSGLLTSTLFAGTLNTAAQGNVTSLGTLTALTVDDVAVDGKVITMTGSASDTAVFTAGTNGTLSIVTTDAAAAAANIQITADGTVDIDSAGVLTLDSGAAINIEPASGSAILLDGTISIDAGVVTGATSITSTSFVGDVTGTSSKATVTDSTANTNFPVVFHNESDGLLDDTGALRYNPSTGELLVPNLTVAGTTTQVDTVTMNAQNAVIFEGATADSNETTLSIVDPTADHTQYLINQGGYIPLLAAATTTAISSTPAELNILDGATVVVGEINALDLGSTAVGTAIASKAVILDSNKDYTGLRNLTITGELDAATLDISGDVDIDGTLETDNLTVGGAQGSDGQVLTSTGSGVGWESASAGTTLSGSTNNTITTVTGSNAIQGESSLTYDGTILTVGSGSGEPQLVIDKADANTGTLRWAKGGSNEAYIQYDASEDLVYYAGSGSEQIFHAGGTEAMRITDAQKVGIGTTAPANLLHVYGNDNQISIDGASGANSAIFFREAGTNKWEFYHRGASDDFRIYNFANTSFDMSIQSDGKVGFGTVSPTTNLTAATSANILQTALTSSSNAVAWDAIAKANAYHVTTENTTFSAPSNAVEGAIISVEIAQGGTARTVAWNTVFEFASSTAPTITATANKTDILTFRYNGSVWQEIGRVQNMAQT